MSLAEQSQQWFPTSVQVTVLQARGLRSKGKNGTNDAYAIMQVAKEKFSTSVAEKSVAPVWKEEAAFDLPLFHLSNAERCTLQVCVMHRALMGPDKMLGQATINLLELQDNKSRNKTEWFKLMGKTGKADKDRGEVLLDVQFMKNNMTASMYDLSGQDKSRSRLGKIKDKLKGKKKNGMSDSASAIVPSVGQVLTDSEGEEPDATPGAKKKNKLKSLFTPKPGLHRNISQSMSTLATLPEKDSPISLSRSSGLNIESPEGKKKFKFLKHKRTGSSDSKVSQGTGSLGMGMVQSNMCINGSHVYTEEPETRGSRAGSTFSLNSSGHGSMEDLRRGHDRKTSSTSMDSSDQTQDNAVEEMHRRQEEQRKHEEEVRKRLEEERRQAEEEERKQIEREQEEERKRLEREEEKRKLQKLEEERKRIEREEERKRIEKEEERKRIETEEERKRIEREEERKLLEREEERKRIEIEEERIWMEREEEKRKLEKQEEERRNEEEERERKRIKREEIIRIKKEQERVRQEEESRKAEEERIKEEKRKRMEEEEKARKEEDKWRRIEEEERTRVENEKLQKEEETRKLEMDRRRAEEEERLLKEKEKMEVEEKKKRKEKEEEEERRLSEEMERKEQERVRQEKEKLELANKRIEERMREEQARRKAEEEEKRKLKEKADEEIIRQEKEEMERQKKEKEQQPEVKPRSARMNTSKKASDEINSDHILFTNPFEDALLFDESSTNPFEQPTVSQPEALSRSTKVSAVKPRPHAVKPLSTTDKQPDLRETHDASRSAKITDDMQVKIKAPEAKGTGPYSQLTHEELINLLEKQKQQLSQKDAKIGELELYIDSLLVRVMEESPNILMSLSLMKKSV
ncbi:rab11 family-interacting protein 1-like [Sinocyclocheilus grahami]|uniref:Rab11 family-interacting protein 1-like n=1 Tax=Sinocyclocheilus grahami TaxID=75366 RepID=A0A672P5A7_SINGR|nr:PREDICTED: rab11 family-interacting protein 1-like [Sinocyclocheilus grahami]